MSSGRKTNGKWRGRDGEREDRDSHEWENSSFVVLETTSELSEGSNP